MGKIFTPKKDCTFSPFRKYPRNHLCPCDSGKKFKKCCQNSLNRYVYKTEEQDIKDEINRWCGINNYATLF